MGRGPEKMVEYPYKYKPLYGAIIDCFWLRDGLMELALS